MRTITENITLDSSNVWSFKIPVTLNNNSRLNISAYNSSEDSTLSVYGDYITSPYEFVPSLTKYTGDTWPSEEIFVSNAQSDRIFLTMDYNIYIDRKDAVCEITFQEETTSYDITDSGGQIRQEISTKLFNNANAGLYNATIKMTLQPVNGDLIENTYNLKFYLIPDSLYLLLTCLTGVMYPVATGTDISQIPAYDPNDSRFPATYNEIYPGTVEFQCRVYEGVDNGASFSVSTLQKDKNNTGGHLGDNSGNGLNGYSILERNLTNFKISATQSGWNTLTIYTGGYWATYCFYIKEVQSNLDWFDTESMWTRNYYNAQGECTPQFDAYKSSPYIETSVIKDPVTISGIVTPD